MLLTVLAHCEVVAEMIVQQWKGDDGKWKLVWSLCSCDKLFRALLYNFPCLVIITSQVDTIESLKAFYRLIILFKTNGSMMINGGQVTIYTGKEWSGWGQKAGSFRRNAHPESLLHFGSTRLQ